MDVFVVSILTPLQFAMVGSLFALSTYVTMRVGLLSFAPVTVAAVGGFLATFAASHAELDLWAVLVVGGVAGCATGSLFIPLAHRLESDWLALSTVAIMLVAKVAVVNLPAVTGGPAGTLVPFEATFLPVVMVTLLCFLLVARTGKARHGLAGWAVREDRVVASSMGIPVGRVYALAFMLSGGIAGLAGVLYSGTLQYIGPDTFYFDVAVSAVAAAVLGGSYHWGGSFVGALVIFGLPNYLGQFIVHGQAIASGVILLAIMIWLPGGLLDPVRGRRARSLAINEEMDVTT